MKLSAAIVSLAVLVSLPAYAGPSFCTGTTTVVTSGEFVPGSSLVGTGNCVEATLTMDLSYQPGVVIDCLDEAELARTKELTIRAIDDAYADQIGRLFRSWMGDSHGQPGRAQVGVSQAITAWRTARRGADAFMPPQCTVTRAE